MDQLVQQQETPHQPQHNTHSLGTGLPKSLINPLRQTGRCLINDSSGVDDYHPRNDINDSSGVDHHTGEHNKHSASFIHFNIHDAGDDVHHSSFDDNDSPGHNEYDDFDNDVDATANDSGNHDDHVASHNAGTDDVGYDDVAS